MEVTVSLPEVASREDWLDARKNLLAREKELTRQRDALSAERRRLPMVRIDSEPCSFISRTACTASPKRVEPPAGGISSA